MTKKIRTFTKARKYMLAYLLLTVGVMSSNPSIGDEDVSYRSYINNGQCNFLVADLCLGLDDGDELKITIPVDYILYDLKFTSGIKVRIYSGFNPKVESYEKGKQKKCAGEECYSFFDGENGSGYILYKENNVKYPKYIHFNFSGVTVQNKKDLEKFLLDIRKCKIGNKIKCGERSPFQQL